MMDEAKLELAAAFKRGGCVRLPDQSQRERSSDTYKKGYEIRLTASTWDEIDRIRQLLSTLGLKPAQPYLKELQIVQPVYGRDVVELLLGRPAAPVAQKPEATTVKRLVGTQEKRWFARLPKEQRKHFLMQRFYDRVLAADAHDKG